MAAPPLWPKGTACAGALTTEAELAGTLTIADAPAGTVTRSVKTPPELV